MSGGEKRGSGHHLQLREYVQHISRVMQRRSERPEALRAAREQGLIRWFGVFP